MKEKNKREVRKALAMTTLTPLVALGGMMVFWALPVIVYKTIKLISPGMAEKFVRMTEDPR